MRYTITFINKKGKVKGRVGCNTFKTVEYVVEMWKTRDNKKGVCLVADMETDKKHIYLK